MRWEVMRAGNMASAAPQTGRRLTREGRMVSPQTSRGQAKVGRTWAHSWMQHGIQASGKKICEWAPQPSGQATVCVSTAVPRQHSMLAVVQFTGTFIALAATTCRGSTT